MHFLKSQKIWPVFLIIIIAFVLTIIISGNKQILADEIDRDQLREDFQEYLYDFDDDELQEALTSEYLEKLEVDSFEELNDRQEEITIEAAIEDTEFLFKTLKYGYGGYQYFGGDERFQAAKNNIIEELESQGSPTDIIKVDDFDNLIDAELKFVKDNHFRRDQDTHRVNYTLFYNEELKFDKEITESGETQYIEKEKGHKFQGITGYEIEESIWPFIDREGNRYYRPGLLLEITELEKDTISKKIKLESDQEYTEEISLTTIEQQEVNNRLENSEAEKIYEKSEINGIPTIRLRSLMPTGSDKQAQLNQFVSDAEKLKEHDQLIIDLRTPEGGSSSFPHDWIQEFTGKYITYNDEVTAHLRTEASLKIAKNGLLSFEDSSGRMRRIERRYSPLPSHWSDIRISSSQKVENDQDIIVLINHQTRSAAEKFVRYLRKLENITFIGSNTNGALLISRNSVFRLTNSGISIELGTGIQLEPDLKDREGRGYLPDYWMELPDDLDKINFDEINFKDI